MNRKLGRKERLMESSLRNKELELKKHQKDLEDLKIRIEKASQKRL